MEMLTRTLGLALLAFGLACPSQRQSPPAPQEKTMSTTENTQAPAAELTGEAVTISTTGDFRVGHGRFRLRNAGSQELIAALDGLWFEVNGQRQPLQLGSIHDVDRGQNLDPDDIRLAAGETLTVLIGFPPFVHNPQMGEQDAVVVRLRAGASTLEASSPLRFERRIPRVPR
jgi:hypothetical protein